MNTILLQIKNDKAYKLIENLESRNSESAWLFNQKAQADMQSCKKDKIEKQVHLDEFVTVGKEKGKPRRNFSSSFQENHCFRKKYQSNSVTESRV